MATIGNRSWQRCVGTGLLALASPLLLGMAWVVLVDFPWDVILSLRGMFSGRDVVQVADGEETGVTLFLLLLAACGACWLSGLRPALKIAITGAFYSAILTVPIIAMLGIGAECGLQALLARRGYEYCTFHVTSRSKGEHGTYVYVRGGLPSACDATRAVFPPHQVVPDRLEAFDLPSL